MVFWIFKKKRDEEAHKKIDNVHKILPDCAISQDMMVGFCGETEADHQMTLDVMKEVRYDGAYMFKYSPREGTKAFKMEDDVTNEIKSRRLQEIIQLQQKISYEINQTLVGQEEIILVEGLSKKSDDFLSGRTDTNKVVIIPNDKNIKPGDFINVKITRATQATLFGSAVENVESPQNSLALTA